jgi:hypothetical protein
MISKNLLQWELENLEAKAANLTWTLYLKTKVNLLKTTLQISVLKQNDDTILLMMFYCNFMMQQKVKS